MVYSNGVANENSSNVLFLLCMFFFDVGFCDVILCMPHYLLGTNYLLGEQGGEQGGNLLVKAREQGGVCMWSVNAIVFVRR